MVDNQSSTHELDFHFTEYGIPYRNLWYMLVYAWNEPPDLTNHIFGDINDVPSLDSLLCQILVKLVQQRFRIGLGHDYLLESNAIRGIRGKINFGESLKRNLFDRGQSFCQYYEYHMNVPKNQIIRTTMMKMIRLGNFGPDKSFGEKIRQRLRVIVRAMDGIDFVELNHELIERQQLGRNDRDYRIMLSICRLLIQKQIPSDTHGQIIVREFDREAIVFHDLFELFIANFYRYKLLNWEVLPQKHFTWHELYANNYLPIMKPDLFFREKISNQVIILDTKFAHQTIRNRWGGQIYDSDHLYQIYTYVKTQEKYLNFHPKGSGILLYPTTKMGVETKSIQLDNHVFWVACIDLSMRWQQIETELLNMFEMFDIS